MLKDEYICDVCGEEIVGEYVDFAVWPQLDYRGVCACTEKERKDREAEERSRQRYDFSKGAKDKTYKTPTLGDLLKARSGKPRR